MKQRRRVEITVERHRVFVVRPSHEALDRGCPVCGGAAVMVTPEESASIAGVGLRAVFGWIEAGLVHFAETTEGRKVVCLASLAALPHAFDP